VQLVQLQQAKPLFEALGYKVAALSYDSPPLLDEFAQRKGIDYQFPAG
jgi:peroxiredoxin